jgi:outer membrane protein assembly factor BamB
MNIRQLGLMLMGLFFAISGCSSHQVRNWDQFHGNLSNQGYQEIKSGYALSSAWVSPPYPITTSSPVIGTGLNGSELLYVGTSDARLLAVDTGNGRLLWQRRLAPEGESFKVLSSPAVAESGAIYTLTSRKIGFGRLQTQLVKIDQLGFRRWKFAFPANSFATGSPKTINFKGNTLILVQVTTISDEKAYGALYVIEDEGDRAVELSHRSLSTGRSPLKPAPVSRNGLLNDIEAIWAIRPAAAGATSEAQSTLNGSFLMPTPAISAMDEHLSIAIVDNTSGYGVYRWDGRSLKVAWWKQNSGPSRSSPALLPGHLMVFGQADGAIVGVDLITGAQRWVYQVNEPALATPAGPAEKYVFVVSRRHLIRLDADTGQPATTAGSPGKIMLTGFTYASPALTLNRIYISSREMLTVSFDLKTRGHDTGFRGNGLSTAAIGRDGSVYAVAADGAIHKYQGTH